MSERGGAGVVRAGVAGAAAVWAMDRVGWFLYRREDPAALAREHAARVHGLDVAHALVRKGARAAGSSRFTGQPNAAGLAVHYGLGVVPALAYDRLREAAPVVRSGRGALYGAALFALNDLALARLLGVASPHRRYPWQAHARGLVAHVVLGMATEAVLRRLEDPPVDGATTISSRVDIGAPPDDVFGALTDLQALQEWSTVTASHDGPPGPLTEGQAFRQRLRVGGVVLPTRWRCVVLDPPRVVAYEVTAPVGGRLHMRQAVTPSATGSSVELTLRYDLPGGRLGSLLGRLSVDRRNEREAHRTLENLKAHVERRAGGHSPNG